MVFKIATRKLPLKNSAAQIFQSIFLASSYSFWLDSSREHQTNARFSIMGDCSGPYAYRMHSCAQGHTTIVHGNGETEELRADLFECLAKTLANTYLDGADELPFDFRGGIVGYLGYELMAITESVIGHKSSLPDATLLFVDRFFVVDHNENELYLIALHHNDPSVAENWLAKSENILAELPILGERTDYTVPLSLPREVEPYLLHNKAAYLKQISSAKKQILEGESYEICLTNRVRVPIARGDAQAVFDAYLVLRHINPAPYACLLRFGSTSVLCSSPERFIKIGKDGLVEAKPVKGTMPRSADPMRDQANRKQLLSDQKFFSENLMIVDLLRNDLSRSCKPGSVHVPDLMHVESYATVHQLVSTIRGTLQTTATECIAQCFPGGSMTGAPKRRTLEIINALEEAPRGIYSGAIGYFSLNGTADFNIVIRTIVIDGAIAEIGVGGAIIHLSDAQEEYDEMLLKALAPFSAVAQLVSAPSALVD